LTIKHGLDVVCWHFLWAIVGVWRASFQVLAQHDGLQFKSLISLLYAG